VLEDRPLQRSLVFLASLLFHCRLLDLSSVNLLPPFSVFMSQSTHPWASFRSFSPAKGSASHLCPLTKASHSLIVSFSEARFLCHFSFPQGTRYLVSLAAGGQALFFLPFHPCSSLNTPLERSNYRWRRDIRGQV